MGKSKLIDVRRGQDQVEKEIGRLAREFKVTVDGSSGGRRIPRRASPLLTPERLSSLADPFAPGGFPRGALFALSLERANGSRRKRSCGWPATGLQEKRMTTARGSISCGRPNRRVR